MLWERPSLPLMAATSGKNHREAEPVANQEWSEERVGQVKLGAGCGQKKGWGKLNQVQDVVRRKGGAS